MDTNFKSKKEFCFCPSIQETEIFFGIVIFWVGGKNSIVKNEKCIIFPKSRYFNSNPELFSMYLCCKFPLQMHGTALNMPLVSNWPLSDKENTSRSSQQRLSIKKLLKILQYLEGKTVSFLQRCWPAACFPVNIAKFLRASTLKNTCEQLLLQVHEKDRFVPGKSEFVVAQ